jgi:hypothetical protein
VTPRHLDSDGLYEPVPAQPGIEPVVGLWPCRCDDSTEAKDQLRPPAEAFRQLNEAWYYVYAVS